MFVDQLQTDTSVDHSEITNFAPLLQSITIPKTVAILLDAASDSKITITYKTIGVTGAAPRNSQAHLQSQSHCTL
jgi:hypothetical protein